GPEGIELARRCRPEVILLDLRMKEMDGFEATRRLKQDTATASIPVLAITASPFGAAREAALAAGCSDFLSKPVRSVDVIAALERHLGARFERAGPADASTEETSDLGRTPALGAVALRLREAASIGSVSELHEIARELALGNAEQIRLGKHIARLTNQFD